MQHRRKPRAVAGAPLVPSLTKTPEYAALKSKVDALPLLSDKLKALDAQHGFYGDLTNDLRARRILTRLVLEDALAGKNLGTWMRFHNSPVPERDKGELAVDVLCAGLQGVPEGLDFIEAGPIVEDFAAGATFSGGTTIQRLTGEGMFVSHALSILENAVTPDGELCAEMLKAGVEQAQSSQGEQFREDLWKNFKDRVTPSPLLLGGIALLLSGVYLAGKWIGRGDK